MPAARLHSAFGETKKSSEWAKDPRCSVSVSTLSERFRKQWDAEKAITQPLGQYGPPRKAPKCQIGPLSKNGPGRYGYHRIELTPPTRVTNAGQRELLVLPAWQVRAGADQHLNYGSLCNGV